MTAKTTTAGGLHCFEVLARLSEYFDGELSPAERAQVDAHLAACDACTRFGGRFAGVVAALRERLAADAPQKVAARLEAALATARTGDEEG